MTIQNYASERYQRLKAEHRCVACGKSDNRTLSGFAYCEACTEKRRQWHQQHVSPASLAAERQSRRTYYLWLRDHHCCTTCGRSDDRTRSGRSNCAVCAAKAHARYVKQKGVAQ